MSKYSIVIFLAGIYFLFIFVLFLIHSDYSQQTKNRVQNISLNLPQINIVNTNDTPKNTKPSATDLQNSLNNLKGDYSLIILDKDLNEVVVINPNKQYYAASLYKVPVAVASKKYIQSQNSQNSVVQTIEQQLVYLLKNSDNSSQTFLINTVGLSNVSNAFKGLGLQEDGDFYLVNKATPNEVIKMFVNLESTKFITNENSNDIINLMYKTNFDDRISDNLREGLQFSHKIGNWGNTGTWHDCGIITGDKKLYVCLMSESTSFDEFLKAGKLTAEFINNL